MASNSGKGYVPEVLILGGLPAAGKSTRAKEWLAQEPARRVRINYDDIRKDLFGPGWKFNHKEEALVKARAKEIFETSMKLGMSVVIDNTNLTPKARQMWKDLAIIHNIEPIEEEVGSELPIWDIIARDKKRLDGRVGRAVIERMALFNGFIDWKSKHYDYEGYVICDLDGTLCDITERRKFMDLNYCSECQGVAHGVNYDPKDAGKGSCPKHGVRLGKDWKSFFANVDKDRLNAPVAELLDMFAEDGLGILLVSGRPIDPCGIPTEDWLSAHGIKYDHLFMRQGGDHRSDVIVKQEILDLLPIDQIDYVLDDRNSVVEMWRKNGLFCLQVADGAF
jgi:predicted kinase